MEMLKHDLFKIYVNRRQVHTHQRWMCKSGPYYLLRLGGINAHLEQGQLTIEPIYYPFIGFRNDSDQRSIELYVWRDRAIVIFFFKRWPFIYIYHIEQIKLDYEEE